MQVVEQSYEIVQSDGLDATLADRACRTWVERVGRTCYESEHKITRDSADEFVRMITRRGHRTVIKREYATVKFITDRGVTHELVRHRPASYSQESTLYVNYGGDDIKFIRPVWCESSASDFNACIKIGSPFELPTETDKRWMLSCVRCEGEYNDLLKCGCRPEQARSVLNNSLKTEIVMTANAKEWLHVFALLCSKQAHPQIRQLMNPLLVDFASMAPSIFKPLLDIIDNS